jgi:DNA-binding NarL/FixJ family response regulator
MRIAIVCQERLVRDGLLECLRTRRGLHVIIYEPSTTALLEALADGHDIVLVDASDGTVWFADTPLPEHPRVIFVDAPEDDRWAALALSAGARGIVPMSSRREDVLLAIDVVRDGGIWARRRWLNACVCHVVGQSRQRIATQHVLHKRLSEREREVLSLVVTGAGNKELADRLAISEATVKVHLTRIFQKLGVTGRTALAVTYHDAAKGDHRRVPLVYPLGRVLPNA